VGEQDPSYFVVLQHGWGGSGFARTLHLEHSEITTCVVNVPEDHPKAIDWIVAEVEAAQGFVEVYYDISGRRHEPILIHLPLNPEKSLPLGSEDVLLVTGGGKGIAAECALSLARETGVQLALLGRSKPDTDPDLAANLDRIAAFRVRCRYFAVDVTDTVAFQRAIAEIEEALGPVSAILHGAGTNRPQLLDSLDEDAFFNTLRPKTLGALNVLKAVNPDRLKLFVAFSSIIARTGMAGEADYALANEWLSHLTERWKEEHPHCRCLAIEWSVWSGVGMGERLGRVEALARQGITAITPDKGVAVFRRLLACSPSKNSVVVSGRFPDVPTLNCERPDLPLLRFLEQTRVFFPGIELIVDAELSAPNDPYVEDHIFRGERLFPAVMGLEAMAQVAMALGQTAEHPTFEEIKFARPIVVPPRSQVTIRLAALVGGKDRIEVVVRSSESFFQIDHFRATCRFGAAEASPGSNVWSKIDHLKSKLLTLDAGQDLYGKILFQSGRFARLHGYYFLTAKECLVEITPDGTDNWFGHYLPQKLVLGDPGARDTMIHSIQACIPHGTLLPTGVDRITFSSRQFSDARFGYAKERSRDGDNFVYDLEIMDANGRILEQWEGLQLRKIGDIAFAQEWPSPLIGPYVERRFRELIPGAPISLVLMQNGLPDERQPTEQATQQLLGKNFSLLWRPDGKPEVAAGNPISVAHCGRFTLAVSSPTLTGCDFEPVTARPSSLWRDLIGAERFPLAEIIARETGECEDSAATRVWTACECLKKVGSMADTPLVLESVTKDGWTIFGAGSQLIASFVGPLKGFDRHVGLAILVQTTSHAEGADAGL